MSIAAAPDANPALLAWGKKREPLRVINRSSHPQVLSNLLQLQTDGKDGGVCVGARD